MSRGIRVHVEGPSPDHVKAFSDRNRDAVDDDRCQDEKVVDRNNDATGSAGVHARYRRAHALKRSRDPSSGMTSSATCV